MYYKDKTNMWAALARTILKNRIILIISILLVTCFMVYRTRQVKVAYSFTQFLPNSDSASIDYENFKKQFGLDGTVMVVGMQVDSLFSNLNEFNDWYNLNYDVKNMHGIKDVVSAASIYLLSKNDSLEKFDFKPLLVRKPVNQKELDSAKKAIYALPFYDGFIFNKKSNSTLMAVTFKDNDVNTSGRISIVDSLKYKVDAFATKYHVAMHYSGMPYIRTVISRKVMSELSMFLFISIAVTSIILFFFFRALFPVIFPLIIVSIGVIWSMASISLLGYQITVLTGLIPPLITVIGIPNCILLLNKYHTEYRKHGNKMQALHTTIEKIGISLFLANVTTAIGFAVFCSTRSQALVEFGLISSLNVMVTYAISLILVPVVFSYLPPPKVKQLKHLERKHIVNLLSAVDRYTQSHRKQIYFITLIVIAVSLYGVSKIKAIGYVIDDLPKNDPIYTDMRYFENHFGGVLPFEVLVDSKKPNGIFADNGRTLFKMERFEKMIKQYPYFARPISLIGGLKYANQAFHDEEPKYFILPTLSDMQSILQYTKNSGQKQQQKLTKSAIDSSKQITRIEVEMADVGSVKMKEVLASIEPRADSIFNYSVADKSWVPADQRYRITYTGSSLIFLRGNDFLVTNLIESVLLAVILISIIMFLMFMSPRMVLIATLPSIIPLIVTLGLMGFFNIHLKPSTILIFSIAFGISSDGTMYFLTKYRQEIKNLNLSPSQVISLVIKETGVSMVYTAIILSFGFLIFIFSGFGGTKAMGILVSMTLLMAYCSNLVLLPSFMLSMEKFIKRKTLSKAPLLDIEEEKFEDEADKD
ncbi:MAG TPA: MMPL family transporter [Bacteroidia bacterium]|nr:MMPL family transporter [Bacteroidia bacterium]